MFTKHVFRFKIENIRFIIFTSQFNNLRSNIGVGFHITIGAAMNMNVSRHHSFVLLVDAIILQGEIVSSTTSHGTVSLHT